MVVEVFGNIYCHHNEYLRFNIKWPKQKTNFADNSTTTAQSGGKNECSNECITPKFDMCLGFKTTYVTIMKIYLLRQRCLSENG